MTDFASSLTRTIARQYDLFQASLEFLQKERKFLNYGYTVSGKETYEERQERLCLEVFQAAEIGQGDVVIDVGFGSGEQDFLLSNACEFSRLVGFNISERQVHYANERAIRENLAHKLSFRLGEAERLTGVADSSVDRILAIECAFYFDRPRFYRRAAQVLKPDGLVVLADTSPIVPRSWREGPRTCDGSARNRQTVPNGRGISAHDPCAASITGPGPGRR